MFFSNIVEWWDCFGDEKPELKAFVIKVLGLTCSASECERNWSTFNQVHTKRRKHLSTKKMNSLVYIMYNRKLKLKFLKKRSPKVEDDLLFDVPSDDEWVANPSDEEDGVAIGVDEPIEVDDGDGDGDKDDSDHGYEYDGGAMQFDHVTGNYNL